MSLYMAAKFESCDLNDLSEMGTIDGVCDPGRLIVRSA
jgi:hypothetical protein